MGLERLLTLRNAMTKYEVERYKGKPFNSDDIEDLHYKAYAYVSYMAYPESAGCLVKVTSGFCPVRQARYYIFSEPAQSYIVYCNDHDEDDVRKAMNEAKEQSEDRNLRVAKKDKTSYLNKLEAMSKDPSYSVAQRDWMVKKLKTATEKTAEIIVKKIPMLAPEVDQGKLNV